MEISVIIPVFNTEKYLEECLDSVLAQQFKDWECLLIDDGSTDRSGNICDLYVGRDNRFKVFHTVNGGASSARNLGIKYASGKYIAFIDSDDTVDEEYLSNLYKAAEKSKSELTVCGMKLIYPFGVETYTVAEGSVVIGNGHSDRFVELNQKFLLYGPVVKLYRSDIIKNNKIRFPLAVHYGEDLIFNLEYLEYVNEIHVIDSPGYNYRILSTGSLSSSFHSRNFENNYRQWKKIHSFFEKRDIEGTNARTFLSNRLWGIGYDLVLSSRLPVRELRDVFCTEFVNDLKAFNEYTIDIPNWLKILILNRLYQLIWLIQRRHG